MDNINEKVELYRNNAFNKKLLLFSFLETFPIDDSNQLSINDYITDSIIKLEQTDNDNYVYWVDGGLSWYRWYNENLSFDIANFDSAMAMAICNLKFNYICNDTEKYQEKINELYQITEGLQELLGKKGYNCEIKTSDTPYNIKLILKGLNTTTGGSPVKRGFDSSFRQTNNARIYEKLSEIRNMRQQNIFDYKNNLPIFNPANISIITNKTILEFNVENFKNNFNIETFKQFYINNNSLINTSDVNNRYKLNVLNDIGLLTYSIINNSLAETRVEETSGINIEALRQKQFIERLNNLNEAEFNSVLANLKIIYLNLNLTSNLDNYKYETHKDKLIVPILKLIGKFYVIVFSKADTFNFYFESNVKDISYQYSYNYYTKFIDFVDRCFVTLFRPVINSFIREINNELYEKHGIKLFVAGGDSMRRYDYDSSFSADIDTKLHIQNATSTSSMTKQEIENSIFNIIMCHIVNAQNYFETNKLVILEKFVSQRNGGQNVFKCENKDFNLNMNVSVLTTNPNHYQFRTRKIDINKTMPVDLFSIDFKYFVKITEYGREYISERNIALLDIVVSKDKDFDPNDLIEIDGVAYASQSFLLNDLKTTYNTEKMALGRLSNGKVDKDIIRYYKLKDNTEIAIQNKDVIAKELTDLKKYIFNEDIKQLKEILDSHKRLSSIIEKLEKEQNINKQDEFFIRNINLNLINAIQSYLPNFGGLLKQIWKYDPISYQIRDLRLQTTNNSEILDFFNRIKQIPTLDVLIKKIEEKEALDIHDFFIINDLCNNKFSNIIPFDEFIRKFTVADGREDLVKLFDKILNFKINLPFEELNLYNDDYNDFCNKNHLYDGQFESNFYYVVFKKLCKDTTTTKHSVSFSKNVVNTNYKNSIGLQLSFGRSSNSSSFVDTRREEEARKAKARARAAKAAQTRADNAKKAEEAAKERAMKQQAAKQSAKSARDARSNRRSLT